MPNPARRIVALAVLAAAIIAGAVALDLPSAAAQSDDETGRIVAQRLADGRTEFGWQPAGAARVLPRARYFPADAQVGRWLNSSPVEVGGAEIGRINARLRDDGRIEFAFTPIDGERIEPPTRYFPVDARVGRWLRSTEITISTAPAATGFVAISARIGYTCAIRTSGAIECWGNDTVGWHIAGERRPQNFTTGVLDAPSGEFRTVSTGYDYACAIRESGAITCWGGDHYEEVGKAGFPEPSPGSFSAVSVGQSHACAIRAGSGEIACWGATNGSGQLDAPAGSFTAVSAGWSHNCAIRESDRAIECWGDDISYWTYEGFTATGVLDAPSGEFRAVSAGSEHTCAIRTSGAIECWGDDTKGLTAAPPGRFTAVSAGDQHACAIRVGSGEIACWRAANESGQLDAPAGSFTAVAVADTHTCAIRESGAIECWGNNAGGQTDAPTP